MDFSLSREIERYRQPIRALAERIDGQAVQVRRVERAMQAHEKLLSRNVLPQGAEPGLWD